jgi:sulfite exporter TauE/SafE
LNVAKNDPMAPRLSPDAISSVLQTTDTRALWLATVTNQLSCGMQQAILGWVVLTLTQSSGMVGLAFTLHSAPNLVVGFAAGAISDHLERRTLMRFTSRVRNRKFAPILAEVCIRKIPLQSTDSGVGNYTQ